ncbi:hypothetical protein [Mesorhizobium sp.]|uniref:hypothetical protein n=1 Tax=Mesorhizobium sp. TaxID=1871066 RepID=UPI000FE73933|nr:hypothetical protein [Mesorhizobium sp.]RWF33743.1 MAG: hypothetical protein EOS45_02090 [Mesorhizobium sp.]
MKEAAFFAEQGGLVEEWGKGWVGIVAKDIEDARSIGASLTWPKKSISVLLEEAKARVAAMSPDEREAMWQAQRESWVRGEMAMGETIVAKQAHPLSDEQIAEFWPDADPADIRRQFDALMAHLARNPRKGFPRYAEHMAEIVAEKARTLPDRINGLKAALAGLPEQWKNWQWAADAKQAFGEKYVRVVGDNGYGMGRQYIAAVPAGPKGYFGTVCEFIAAANPDTVGMLLSALDTAEAREPALPEPPAGWFLYRTAHEHTQIVFNGDTHKPHGDLPWVVEFQGLPHGGLLTVGRGKTFGEAWERACAAVAGRASA